MPKQSAHRPLLPSGGGAAVATDVNSEQPDSSRGPPGRSRSCLCTLGQNRLLLGPLEDSSRSAGSATTLNMATARRGNRAPSISLSPNSTHTALDGAPLVGKEKASTSNGNNAPHRNPATLSTSSRSQEPQDDGESSVDSTTGTTVPRTVAVAVTVTGCKGFLSDGVAVLQHSVMKQQQRRSSSRRLNYEYVYSFYAIYHPSARECAEPLRNLNFTLLERETPVLPEDIRGEYLRTTISESGCCGEKELLKFEAFTLVQHDAVILLDVDSLVLKSLDEAIDLLLDGTVPPASSGINSDPASHIMHYSPDDRRSTIPDDVWILYTPDYAMVDPSQDLKPAQGGFAIFKPNRTIYEQIMDIVREGKIEAEYGWGTPELNTDMFYGVKTFQGLLPYYFQLGNGANHAVLLNWCQYNNMNVHPMGRDNGVDDDGVEVNDDEVDRSNLKEKRCWTNREKCEDCRDRTLEEVSSVHLSHCQKPWLCVPHDVNPNPDDKMRLCHQMHQAWFEFRSEMERSWGRKGLGSTKDDEFVSQFRGYCSSYGEEAYEAIQLPYGQPAIIR